MPLQVKAVRRQGMVFQEPQEEDQLLVPQDQWAKLGRVSLPHLHTKNEWKVGTNEREIEITHHFNYFSLASASTIFERIILIKRSRGRRSRVIMMSVINIYVNFHITISKNIKYFF